MKRGLVVEMQKKFSHYFTLMSLLEVLIALMVCRFNGKQKQEPNRLENLLRKLPTEGTVKCLAFHCLLQTFSTFPF